MSSTSCVWQKEQKSLCQGISLGIMHKNTGFAFPSYQLVSVLQAHKVDVQRPLSLFPRILHDGAVQRDKLA